MCLYACNTALLCSFSFIDNPVSISIRNRVATVPARNFSMFFLPKKSSMMLFLLISSRSIFWCSIKGIAVSFPSCVFICDDLIDVYFFFLNWGQFHVYFGCTSRKDDTLFVVCVPIQNVLFLVSTINYLMISWIWNSENQLAIKIITWRPTSYQQVLLIGEEVCYWNYNWWTLSQDMLWSCVVCTTLHSPQVLICWYPALTISCVCLLYN